MSAAIDNMRKNWLTIALSFSLSFLGGIIMFAATRGDMNEKAINEKIDSKASYQYVNERIYEHSKIEEARYQGIEALLISIKENNKTSQDNTNRTLDAIQQDIRAIRKEK